MCSAIKIRVAAVAVALTGVLAAEVAFAGNMGILKPGSQKVKIPGDDAYVWDIQGIKAGQKVRVRVTAPATFELRPYVHQKKGQKLYGGNQFKKDTSFDFTSEATPGNGDLVLTLGFRAPVDATIHLEVIDANGNPIPTDGANKLRWLKEQAKGLEGDLEAVRRDIAELEKNAKQG